MLTWQDTSSSFFFIGHPQLLSNEPNTSPKRPTLLPSTLSLAQSKHFAESADTRPSVVDDFRWRPKHFANLTDPTIGHRQFFLANSKLFAKFTNPTIDHRPSANSILELQHLGIFYQIPDEFEPSIYHSKRS
jgi:hypothetical protein